MFRNLTMFRFSQAVADDLARLERALATNELRACGALELSTRGFVTPFGPASSGNLTHRVGDCVLFTLGSEEKILPAAVVNQALADKVRAIAAEEDRRVGGRERKRLKADLLDTMLPRAFVRRSNLNGYVDLANGWLVVDTATRSRAELVVSALREALGSFPALPLAPERPVRQYLTDSLFCGVPAGDFSPAWALGDECELRDPASPHGSRWRGRNADLHGEEVKEHLRNGMQAFQLGLTFDDRLSFVLGEDMAIRKFRLLDVVLDELDTSNAETAADELSARFALLTLEVQRLLQSLDAIFGLPRPAD
mgnify:CR=1 FL=1